jgi:hypothetical protein
MKGRKVSSGHEGVVDPFEYVVLRNWHDQPEDSVVEEIRGQEVCDPNYVLSHETRVAGIDELLYGAIHRAIRLDAPGLVERAKDSRVPSKIVRLVHDGGIRITAQVLKALVTELPVFIERQPPRRIGARRGGLRPAHA